MNPRTRPVLRREDHATFNPLPNMGTARHLAASPAGLGDCSLHEFQRSVAIAGQSTPLPQGDGVQVVLKLMGSPGHKTWMDGREVTLAPSRAGQARLFDLRKTFISEVAYAYHSVNLFMPNVGFERSSRGSVKWNWPADNFYDDQILSNLMRSLVPAVRDPSIQDRLFNDLIFQSISRHLSKTYAHMVNRRQASARSLSKSEERRAKEILMNRIDGNITIGEVAASCGVSVDHFSRMFRESTGLPPYRWLNLQRIERAKSLLQHSENSLTEIALVCGYAHQSHFTRMFSREVGVSPGLWRRCAGS